MVSKRKGHKLPPRRDAEVKKQETKNRREKQMKRQVQERDEKRTEEQ
jgi:hypothetical protein